MRHSWWGEGDDCDVSVLPFLRGERSGEGCVFMPENVGFGQGNSTLLLSRRFPYHLR